MGGGSPPTRRGSGVFGFGGRQRTQSPAGLPSSTQGLQAGPLRHGQAWFNLLDCVFVSSGHVPAAAALWTTHRRVMLQQRDTKGSASSRAPRGAWQLVSYGCAHVVCLEEGGLWPRGLGFVAGARLLLEIIHLLADEKHLERVRADTWIVQIFRSTATRFCCVSRSISAQSILEYPNAC